MAASPQASEAIDRTLIESATDGDLEDLFTAYVLRVQSRGPSLELPVSLQAHFVARAVEAQVLAGGFNQLLFKAPGIGRRKLQLPDKAVESYARTPGSHRHA